MPVSFCLAPANEPEREVAEALLERTLSGSEVVVGDKGFAGEELEQVVGSLGALFVRPDRRDERARFGSLGGIRQWIESIVETLKGQLSLERHRGTHRRGRLHPRRSAPARSGRRRLAQRWPRRAGSQPHRL
jgi:hypothetical protein